MNEKFNYVDECPYCEKYKVKRIGYSKFGNKLLKCDNCDLEFCEKNIKYIRESHREFVICKKEIE